MSNNCCPPKCDPAKEPLQSALANFILEFFGSVTKSCVNGKVVWTLPCDLASGIACYPRLPGEGVACYIMRLFELFGLVASGTWSDTTQYCKNAFVTYNGSGYVALQSTLGNQPDTSPTYWLLYVAQGAPGPVGGSPLTTKGDVFVYGVTDSRLPVGLDGQGIVADSTQVLGLKWGSPSSSDTASNLGAGNGVFASKVGNDFQFKSIVGGSNVTITPSGTTLTITVSFPTFASLAFSSSQQVITPAGALTLAHGLGAIPALIKSYIVCQTGELGYTAGDIVPVPENGSDFTASGTGYTVVPDATNLNVRYGNHASVFAIVRKDTGASAAITAANWKLLVRAWK